MNKIKFIDLFCGIGGFRLALESCGMKCVFSAEINKHACDMYEANFSDNPYCDITKLNEKELPPFDILCAGFPCQAFSLAGKQKGFNEARGTLFFEICRIAKVCQPKILLLENVKNLLNHDKGNTFKVIQKSLEEIGYQLNYQVLNAKDFGVPQSRERIIMVATRKGEKEFDFNNIKTSKKTIIEDILESNDNGSNNYLKKEEYTLLKEEDRILQKSGLIFSGYMNKNTRGKGTRENSLHLSRTHRQCNRIYDYKGTHSTLSSQESAGRYYISLKVNNKEVVRKLTLLECYRLMGFPDNFKKIGSKSMLYQRVGNSVCIPVIKAVAKEITNLF